MKITHVFLAGPYNDDWSYHENCLPAYHSKMGFQTSLITSNQKISATPPEIDFVSKGVYIDNNGVKIVRLKTPLNDLFKIFARLGIYCNVYKSLVSLDPDIIFVHCFQVLSLTAVKKYVTLNPSVILYVDNHADDVNSANNILSKYILHKVLWKYIAQSIYPIARKIYGVMPKRLNFLIEMYGLNRDKLGLTYMGAEDEKVENAIIKQKNDSLRVRLGIKSDDFMLITGGKIDNLKRGVLNLMKIVGNMPDTNVKLVVFGSVIESLKKEFDSLLKSNKVIFAGWISGDEVYDFIISANIMVFPGSHSVLWEQTVGSGKPAIFKYYSGMDHLDVGGNCIFLRGNTEQELLRVLNLVINDNNILSQMNDIAQKKGRNVFSYYNLAAQAIEINT